MPWKVKKPTAADVSPDWLRPYCTPFLQKLADQGYAPATMRTYAGAMALFCQEIARRGLGHGQLVGLLLSLVRVAGVFGFLVLVLFFHFLFFLPDFFLCLRLFCRLRCLLRTRL